MKKSRGLSIIEVVLFILILGLAIPPLMIVSADLYNKSVNMETMHISNNLATQKMEDLISKGFDNIVSEAATSFGGQYSTYQYQVTVNYISPSALDTPVDPTVTKYKRISVSVQSPGVTGQTITYNMIVTNE